MKPCPSPLVHFTSEENWAAIQKSGYIVSWNEISKIKLAGRDKTKISAFRNFPMDNPTLVAAFKRCYARMKNLSGPENVVGLVICDSDFDWSEHPNESRELLPFGIECNQLDLLGTYVKSPDCSRVEVRKVCKII